MNIFCFIHCFSFRDFLDFVCRWETASRMALAVLDRQFGSPLTGQRRDTMTRTIANNLTAIVFTLAVAGYGLALVAHTAIKIAA